MTRGQGVAPALVLQLYTEDRRDAGCSTLKEVVLGLLQCIQPGLKTNHLLLKPVQEAPERRVSGSDWKVTPGARDPGAQARRTVLIQDIVTALRLGRVVVFHVDGDDRWLTDGKHAEVWHHLARLRADLERFVFDPKLGRSPLSTQVKLEHVFVPLVPFYSMESWAYANTALLRELLVEPGDLAILAAWERDPGSREDVLYIKATTLSIRDRENGELVKRSRGFPCAELVALGKSYAATLRRLEGSPQVRQGLAEAAERPY